VSFRSDFEARTDIGWARWSPGKHCDPEQSAISLGPFQLTVTKRGDEWENVWEIDLYRHVAYTQLRAKSVDEAEQMALAWALPLMKQAYEAASWAFRKSRPA
jgi:hypothetical protein